MSPSAAGPRPSPTPGYAQPSSTDSPSAAPSSRPAPTPTVWPKPQSSGQPDTRRARKRCRRKPTSAPPTRARRCQNSPTSSVGRNLRSQKGIVPLGTSMDFESPRSRELGCWDGIEFCTPAIDALAEPVGEDWVIPIELVDAVLKEGPGEDVSPEERAFWHATYQKNYTGDAGRKHVRICSINLRDRDGLHGRLDGVRCPVLRMHGTEDPVYSVVNAEDEMKLFVNSPDAELRVVDGGQHFLSASNPDDVNPPHRSMRTIIGRWRDDERATCHDPEGKTHARYRTR